MKQQLNLGLSISLLAAAGIATAGSYQIEAGFGYNDVSFEQGSSDADADGISIGGTFYFTEVDNTKGPLSEAAFIQHASDVSVTHASLDIDDSDVESTDLSIVTRIVMPSNITFTAGYANHDVEQGSLSNDTDSFTFGGGYYINDLTELGLTYQTIEVDDNNDADIIAFTAKALMLDTSLPVALEGGISFLSSDIDNSDGEAFSAAATLYPSRELGVSIGLTLVSLDQEDVTTIDLTGEYFITPQAVVGLAYSMATSEEDGQQDLDTDTLLLSGAYRF